MIVVYGEVPELFPTQNAAIQQFSLTKPKNNHTKPMLLIGGVIIIGFSAYYVYKYFENQKRELDNKIT